MKAKSIKGNSPEEIKTALEQSIADGFQPTLAFVFISIKQDIDAVSTLLQKQNITIFGATSSGEFIDGNVGTGRISILLMDINPEYFLLLLENYNNKDPEALAKTMALRAKEQFKNPVFILSTSIKVTEGGDIGEPILRAIESVSGPDTVIWGGRAGDDYIFDETAVFTNNSLMKRGIIIVAIDGDKIDVKGKAVAGLRPVGTEKIITKATNNWVFEIDNQPASDMVMKYLGLDLFHEEAETFYPGNMVLSVAREKGEPLLRSSGIFNLKEKSIYFPGSINEGDRIKFTLPPDFEIIEEVRRNAELIKQKEMQAADALLIFSCAGRFVHFGPLVGEEIEGINSVFKAPMAGFFCYGEFGRATNGNNEFLNNTCCWVALKEK